MVGSFDLKNLSKQQIAKRFEADNVIEIPQVAAHLDAFMFVDDQKRAYICDDMLTLKQIAIGLDNIQTYFKQNFNKISNEEKNKLALLHQNLKKSLYTFLQIVTLSPYVRGDEAVKVLQKEGYETVRIPGRLYTLVKERNQIQHEYGTNFANAIMHKNNNGDTILLTNESANDTYFGIDKAMENKIGFSFKKIFIDSLSPYIKEENIHFIKGENNGVSQLLSNLGGIHCLSAEIR